MFASVSDKNEGSLSTKEGERAGRNVDQNKEKATYIQHEPRHQNTTTKIKKRKRLIDNHQAGEGGASQRTLGK
jgi:hypothetical protein